jgi:MFS family permease
MSLNVAIIPVARRQGWDETAQGVVLSAFYWGYICTQLPGGWLAPRYGSKLVFGWGLTWAAIFTLIWPFTADNFYLTVFIRVLTGFGEGVTYPAVYNQLAKWFPKTEKTSWASALGVAPSIGTVLANGVSPLIIDYLRWESVFYIAGGFGIVWAFFLVYVNNR